MRSFTPVSFSNSSHMPKAVVCIRLKYSWLYICLWGQKSGICYVARAHPLAHLGAVVIQNKSVLRELDSIGLAG